MALGSVRRWVSLVAVSAAVAVAASGGASSGAAVVLPVVTVSPSTGLVDLQKVTVTGTGFTANAQIATVQCRPGAIERPIVIWARSCIARPIRTVRSRWDATCAG